MKQQPIHQNLNTSFVNVGALVRYLSGLQFVGSIRIELSSYEADIIFTSSRTITTREYDHIAGRISHGESALNRILIRAKEPHGRIHVYESVEGYAGHDDKSVFIDRSIATNAREMAANRGGAAASEGSSEFLLSSREGKNSLVLGALSELLRAIDESLAKEKLSFPAAFELACDAIAVDYAFMKGSRKAIVYENGEIRLRTNAQASSVAAAVFAALRPIFHRLRMEQKYAHLFGVLTNRLSELVGEHRSEYGRLGLTAHIETLLDSE